MKLSYSKQERLLETLSVINFGGMITGFFVMCAGFMLENILSVVGIFMIIVCLVLLTIIGGIMAFKGML